SFTLKDVSFNIPKGQWTSIVGHNGSGKSTIAKLMIGIEKVKSEHNITIISITHDLSEAMEADHVIVMNKGTVYKEGTATEIFDHAEELTTIGLDLPFPIKINQMLGHQTSFLTYEGLVDQL
ncbi:ATP-binding cassette domain-containing protein, partial [Staphylococcus aureus]|nr:ATP-binding cassette domain-containing protein [Staphylococcus aureus]